jgi:hypothetical protein
MAVDSWGVLDQHLPQQLRTRLEDSLWRPIEEQATLEVLQADPSFFADPGGHPAMFADHGVVHVRDVAAGLVRLVDTVDGVLLPPRPANRLHLLKTWGVALTYLHDVGMVDLSPVGRRTHAVYAAQLSFSADVDPLVEHLLDAGEVRRSLEAVDAADPFGVPLETVVREVLSLCVGHSKSTVPAEALTDRAELQRLMRRFVFTSMEAHRSDPRVPPSPEPEGMPSAGEGIAHPSPRDAYAWLTASDGPKADLADDVVDAVRALRAADVLRQRGTVLRTSGGFEIFFDARSGQALCTLRPADGRAAFVVTFDDPRGAGEANLMMAAMTPHGDLRVAFHRGAFLDAHASRRAAGSVANAILDIQADVIPTFSGLRPRGLEPPRRTADEVLIQLERPDDDPRFADLVAAVLGEEEPAVAHRVRVVESVEGAAPDERRRFHHGEPVDPWGPLADEVLARVAEHGTPTPHLDRGTAFGEVRRVSLVPGEVLVEADSPPSFVYLPMGPGLRVLPMGGYAAAPLHPWVPVGVTGAVRRAGRNSAIVAEQPVEVVMVPAQLFVRAWLRPLSPEQLRARLVEEPLPRPGT